MKRLLTCVAFYACILSGCATLSVTAERTADCDIVQGPPHSLKCVIDGVLRYVQTGPQRLNVKVAP